MRGLVNALVVLAVVGFAVGLVLRVTAGDLVAARPALADPVFYWRGAIVLLALAVARECAPTRQDSSAAPAWAAATVSPAPRAKEHSGQKRALSGAR